MDKSIRSICDYTVTGQITRQSSRPKLYRPKPESCRPKIFSQVARNFNKECTYYISFCNMSDNETKQAR